MTIKTSTTGFEIAVIGMSGQFPGADDIHQFWDNLLSATDSISVFSEQELREAGVEESLIQSPNFVKSKGVFPQLEFFDADFFDYTPRDAETLDPQIRALHQCVYHALEDAGYPADGRKRNVGLFAGASGNFNWELSTLLKATSGSAGQFAAIQLNDKDFLSTRLSYKLNLCGPSVAVHSACSTSLYAIDIACRNLYTGACNMAVAAGSGLTIPHKNGYVYEEGMIKSADGKCRPFSEDANGTVEGNGMGAVVLRPLADALKQGDRIYAVIRGTAANNDGNRKVGYSAPSVEGQAEVIRRAIYMADIEPETITYIEAHGTGTHLGDPVEIEGLKQAFNTEKRNFCGVGSLKSNIGHLDTAAGISSFIKTVLALKNKELPPTLNFSNANPEINFQQSPFRIIHQREEWLRLPHPQEVGMQLPLRAGVSSFGIGGTNVHVVLEEAPEATPSSSIDKWQTLCLSAKNQHAITRIEENLLAFLRAQPHTNPTDLAYTYQTARGQFAQRKTFAYQTIDDLQQKLERAADIPVRAAMSPVRSVFLFPGQGTQYAGMAAGLYRGNDYFRRELDACLDECDRLDMQIIRNVLFAQSDDARMRETSVAQLALFSVEYALAKTLMSLGVKPAAMIGHSLGEYVAACIAGVMSLAQAIALVYQRGKLMQSMQPGSMLAVAESEHYLREIMPASLSIAAVNGPQQCTLAGETEAINAFAKKLESEEVSVRVLQTSHAFHSAMMEPMLNEFKNILSAITFNTPALPYISNVTGSWITDEQATSVQYYLDHVRQAVRFADGVEQLVVDKNTVFIELGAGGVLTAFVKQNKNATDILSVSLLRHAKKIIDDVEYFSQALGDIWASGVTIDWRALHAGKKRHLVDAPLYPFAKTSFSIGSGDIFTLLKDIGEPAAVTSAITKNTPETTAPYYFSWQSALVSGNADTDSVQPCIFFKAKKPKSKIISLVGGLRPVVVDYAKKYKAINSNNYHINPSTGADYRRLINVLKQKDGIAELIVWQIKLTAKFDVNEFHASIVRALDVFADECSTQYFRVLIVVSCAQEPSEEFSFEWELWVRRIMAAHINMQISTLFLVDKIKPQALAHILENEIFTKSNASNLVMIKDQKRYAYRMVQSDYIAHHTTPFAGKKIALLTPEDYPAHSLLAALKTITPVDIDNIPITLPPKSNSGLTDLRVDIKALDSVMGNIQQEYLNQYGLSDVSKSHRLVDELCNRLIAEFINHYIPLKQHITFTKAKLAELLGVTSRLEKYVDYFLHILLEDNIIVRVNVTDNKSSEKESYQVIGTLEQLRPTDAIKADISKLNRFFDKQVDLLAHCVNSFSESLSEKILPIEVLYPNGTNGLLRTTYEGSIQELEDEFIRLMFENVVAKVMASTRKIRILEVGGGYGLVMRRIIPLLKNVADVEYYFTDIGTTFLDEAKKFALDNEYDFMHFGLFDVSRSPQEQGLELHSFDLVFAFNVVHATEKLSITVANMKALLRNQGMLCLLERTNIRRYVDLIWGLADGWWHFDEEERQISPLMPLNRWENLLEQQGFHSILAYPNTQQLRDCLDVGVILAQIDYEQDVKETNNILVLNNSVKNPVNAEITPAKNAVQFYDMCIILDIAHVQQHAPTTSLSSATPAVLGIYKQYAENLQSWLNNNKCNSTVMLCNDLTGADNNDRGVQLKARLWLEQEVEKKSAVTSIYLPFDKPLKDSNYTMPSTTALQHIFAVAESAWRHAILLPQHQSLFSLQVNRSALLKQANQQQIATMPLHSAAADHYELLLIDIWQNLFGLSQLTANDDFFELGGDSLKVAQLTTELAKHNIKISPNEVFNNTRIRQLANYLAENYSGTDNIVKTHEDLINYFATKYDIAADFVCYDIEGKQINILFLEDIALQTSGGYVDDLLSLNLAVENQPNYICPLSKKIDVPNVLNQLSFNRLFGLQSVCEVEYEKISRIISHQQRRLSLQLVRGVVEDTYELSPFQKMYLKSSARVSLYEIEFEEMVNRELLDKAFSDIVGIQGLMRSSLDKGFKKLCWVQYAAADNIKLPYLDLSPYALEDKRSIVEFIMKKQYDVNFDDEKGAMFRVLLIRLDLRRCVLLFNLDHSIFDNMTGQVLRRQLLNRYRSLLSGSNEPLAPVKSFKEYLEQLNRGPQGVSPDWLIKIFDLETYGKARRTVEDRIVANRQPKFSSLRYEIDMSRYQLGDDDELSWEITISVLSYTLSRFLQQQDVPLKLLYQGRKYQDLSFFDTLGLFVDVLPLLINVKENGNSADIVEGVSKKINLVNRYNVNFMNMVLNFGMLVKWRDVLGHIAPKKLSQKDPMILLNYVGKAGDEYRNIIDFSISQMLDSNGKLDYASFYTIVTQNDGKIVFDILCNFEKDMDVIKNILDEETERLLGSEHSQQLLKA